MTNWGEKIQNISLDQLKNQLKKEDDAKAVKRLITAIEYKNGLSPAQIEDKYGFSKNTVYEWLDRFEERDLGAALYDRDRPGRTPELTVNEREQLEAVLQASPENARLEGQEWSPRLLHQYIETTFGVDYSIRHVQRLLNATEEP